MSKNTSIITPYRTTEAPELSTFNREHFKHPLIVFENSTEPQDNTAATPAGRNATNSVHYFVLDQNAVAIWINMRVLHTDNRTQTRSAFYATA
jgi:hypothetical protein